MRVSWARLYVNDIEASRSFDTILNFTYSI